MIFFMALGAVSCTCRFLPLADVFIVCIIYFSNYVYFHSTYYLIDTVNYSKDLVKVHSYTYIQYIYCHVRENIITIK